MYYYWQIILEEVHLYEQRGYCCRYSNLQETDIFIEKMEDSTEIKSTAPPKVTYPLPAPYDHLYFTEREAECIYCILQGHTIKSTGILLNLSARTVEFYLKNIKTKMQLRTKSAITDQLSHLDFRAYAEIHPSLQALIATFHVEGDQVKKPSRSGLTIV